MSIIEKIIYYLLTKDFLKDFVQNGYIKLIWDLPYKKFIDLLISFFKKYKKIPNLDEFQSYTKGESEAEVLWLWYQKYSNLYVTKDYNFLIDELRKEYAVKKYKDIVQSTDMDNLDLKEVGYKLLKEATNLENEEEIREGFVYEGIEERIERIENASLYAGIPTGFSTLDDILSGGGWNRKELYLLFARLGEGKSRLLFNCAYNLVKQGYWGIYFSLEMYKEQIYRMFDSRTGNINSTLLKKGTIDLTFYKEVLDLIQTEKSPLYVSEILRDTTVELIEQRIAEFRKDNPLDFIVIDYIGCMEAPGFNKENEKYRYIAKRLKNMAKKEDIVILTAEQANRKAKENEKEQKEVGTENISQSDWIAAYCDFIAYIQSSKLDGALHLKVLKNRDGRNYKTVKMFVDWATNKIWDASILNVLPEEKIQQKPNNWVSSSKEDKI